MEREIRIAIRNILKRAPDRKNGGDDEQDDDEKGDDEQHDDEKGDDEQDH